MKRQGIAALRGRATAVCAAIAARASRALRALLVGGTLVLSPAPSAAAAGDTQQPRPAIEIAIAPFLPARALVANYQPLRAYLEKTLNEPVQIITAPNYLTYFERIARQQYRVIATVPHSAWLAQAESDYVPMLRPLALTHPVLIVAKGSAFKRLTDLRGRTIAVPDPMALISAQALDLLRQNGLEPGRDVSLRHFPTHSAAVNRVLDGEVAAAIVSERALQQMTNGPQERVRVLYSWKQGAVPGIVYLAHPAMPAERVERLTAALLAFANESPEGRVFMEQTGYRGLVRLSPDELAPFAPYGQWLKAEIGRAEERQAPGAAK